MLFFLLTLVLSMQQSVVNPRPNQHPPMVKYLQSHKPQHLLLEQENHLIKKFGRQLNHLEVMLKEIKDTQMQQKQPTWYDDGSRVTKEQALNEITKLVDAMVAKELLPDSDDIWFAVDAMFDYVDYHFDGQLDGFASAKMWSKHVKDVSTVMFKVQDFSNILNVLVYQQFVDYGFINADAFDKVLQECWKASLNEEEINALRFLWNSVFFALDDNPKDGILTAKELAKGFPDTYGWYDVLERWFVAFLKTTETKGPVTIETVSKDVAEFRGNYKGPEAALPVAFEKAVEPVFAYIANLDGKPDSISKKDWEAFESDFKPHWSVIPTDQGLVDVVWKGLRDNGKGVDWGFVGSKLSSTYEKVKSEGQVQVPLNYVQAFVQLTFDLAANPEKQITSTELTSLFPGLFDSTLFGWIQSTLVVNKVITEKYVQRAVTAECAAAPDTGRPDDHGTSIPAGAMEALAELFKKLFNQALTGSKVTSEDWADFVMPVVVASLREDQLPLLPSDEGVKKIDVKPIGKGDGLVFPQAMEVLDDYLKQLGGLGLDDINTPWVENVAKLFKVTFGLVKDGETYLVTPQMCNENEPLTKEMIWRAFPDSE